MYGLLIAFGILISTLLSEKIAKKAKLNPDILWEGLPFVLVFAIIGARFYHVLDFWKYYSQNPFLIVAVWKGGLGILGGLIAGSAALLVFLKYKRRPVIKWLDIICVSVPLAQALGRMGNFFNKELYGIGPIPFFAMEAFLNVILFLVLYLYFIKYQKNTFGFYLIGCGFIRFALEFFRTDSWHLGTINVAQVVSIVFVVCGIIALKKSGGGVRSKS